MIEQIKRDAIEHDRAAEKSVKLLPRSGSLQAEQRKNKGQQDCARGGEKIEIPIVGVLVGRNILPADDKRDIQVKPPQHQKKEVENAQPCSAARGLAFSASLFCSRRGLTCMSRLSSSEKHTAEPPSPDPLPRPPLLAE